MWGVLRRPLYRGEIVWNQTRMRNAWGIKAQTPRPDADRLTIEAPDLRIVPEALWQTVQARATAAREAYRQANSGAIVRRQRYDESKYLLTGLARCGLCGASMLVRSRDHGKRRAYFYACSAYHRRGRTVCPNSLAVRIEEADETILTEIERYVLHPAVVRRAIELTIDAFRPASDGRQTERARLERERRKAEAEVSNLTAALAAGGSDLPPVLAALRAADERRQTIATQLEQRDADTSTPFTTAMAADLEQEVLAKLADWRATMRREAPEARQVLRQSCRSTSP